MATYDLKYPGAAIDAILDTAYDLQNAGYIFRGPASEYSNTPTERSWVLAGEGETGHGFTSPIPKGYIGVCVFNGTSWTGKLLKCVSIDSTPTNGSTNAVSSGGAYASISQLADTVNEALDNLTFTDTTPSAFLGEYITEKVSTTDDGIERILTYFTILSATASKAGLLSAADKAKLDAILGNLRSLEIDDTTAYADLGDKIVESIKATIGGTEETISTFQILAATASKAGLLSAADKAKLDALWSSGYQFAGIATPSTTPVSTTSKIFYIATEAGTYFNAVIVTQGINILSWDGTTWSAAQVIGIDDEPTPASENLVKSGGVASMEGYYEESSEFLKADLDSQNKVIWGIRKDGSIYFGGGKSPIQSEVADCLSMIENPEYVNIEIDDAGRVLGGRKANGSKVEGAPIEMPSAVVESLSDAEDRIEILLDKNGRVISYRDKGGVLHEYSAVINNLDVENVNFKDGVPEQIQEYVESYIVKTEDKDIIPYNDTMRIGKVMRKVYNPYKETKTHQYKGQMHCHCWTKFGEFSDRIPYLYNHPDYDSIYEDYGVSVPISITGFHNVSGTTKAGSTIKLGDAIVAASASRFLSQHKNAGYDFMSITDYAVYGNVTQKPSVIPNDFLWLWNGYETTTKTLGVNQHMVVHNVASNESIRYNQGTFKDIMDILEDEGCIVQWPHPTDIGTPVTPDNGVVETVKSRLRLMEVYDGISYCKYYINETTGVVTRSDRNVNALLPGVLPDDPYDQMLTQGNFIFCMAISDERPAIGRGNVDTDEGPRNTAITTENNAYNLQNGCIKVFSDTLTQKDIFDSLLAGNFYASSNADVSIQSVVISNGVYAVDTGMVGVTVEFLKENNTILRTIVTSSNSTVASYDIQGDEKFVRARVYKTRENVPPSSDYWFVDKDWCIWTQPVFISSSIL